MLLLFSTACIISIFVNAGKACQRQVINPAIFGVANDVPFPVIICPVGDDKDVPTPTEATAGFTRPSLEGPKLLKLPTMPDVLTAPTATTLSASAGVVIKCHALVPSLPAATTTIITFFAARSAALAMSVVLPFMSA